MGVFEVLFPIKLVDRLVGNRHNTFASGISVGFRTMRNESFQKRRALKTAFYGENVIFEVLFPISFMPVWGQSIQKSHSPRRTLFLELSFFGNFHCA